MTVDGVTLFSGLGTRRRMRRSTKATITILLYSAVCAVVCGSGGGAVLVPHRDELDELLSMYMPLIRPWVSQRREDVQLFSRVVLVW